MIAVILATVLLALLLAFIYNSISKFTLREYKLAFKVGAFTTASILILFAITILF